MLAQLLTSQSSLLDKLVAAWRTNGATALGFSAAGTTLASWPSGATPNGTTLTAPIQTNGPPLGLMWVTGCHDAAAQCRLESDASLLSGMVQQYDDLEMMTGELIDTQDQLLALYDLTRAARSNLRVEETLRSLTAEAARLIKAQGAVISLSSRLGYALVQYPPQFHDEALLGDFCQKIQLHGGEVLINSDDPQQPPLASLHAVLFVPIRIRGAIIAGTLGLLEKIDSRFDAPDLKLARAIAEQVGALIEQALLYQESLDQTRLQTEMDLARNVQQNLLPQNTPQIAGIDVYARARPARQVGGDFYDFIIAPGRPFIFVVGDVTGKGISAALLMAMTRTSIRSKASYMLRPTPEAVMSRSNEDLYDDFSLVGMFATVFIGQYEPSSRQITFTSAGHSPVVYCPQGGAAQLIEPDGTPMGVLPVSIGATQRIPFHCGDLLVIATDGFNEAMSPYGEFFGYDRLFQFIQDHADLSARAFGETLFATIEQFSAGRPQDDDQTLIVIKGSLQP